VLTYSRLSLKQFKLPGFVFYSLTHFLFHKLLNPLPTNLLCQFTFNSTFYFWAPYRAFHCGIACPLLCLCRCGIFCPSGQKPPRVPNITQSPTQCLRYNPGRSNPYLYQPVKPSILTLQILSVKSRIRFFK
jgi:hypothetical protein